MQLLYRRQQIAVRVLIWVSLLSFSLALSAQEYVFQLDLDRIGKVLDRAPLKRGGSDPVQLELPAPGGEKIIFDVMESPVVDSKVAQRLQIRTFAVSARDGSGRIGRLSYSPRGLYGIFNDGQQLYFIDRIDPAGTQYRVFYDNSPVSGHHCGLESAESNNIPAVEPTPVPGVSLVLPNPKAFGGTLRTYDLVVAGTEEYTAAFADQATAETNIVNIVNAFNLIFQPEMSIALNLVDYNALTTDSYDADNGDADLAGVIIGEVFPNTASYDIGHAFHKLPEGNGGSGEAGLGAVCTADKGNGWSSDENPIATNAGWIKLAAHEVAHQFGANHTFDGTAGDCVQRSSTSAFEPLGGSTIMGYFGVCENQNISNPSLSVFHVHSLEQMNNFVTSGAGNSCATTSNTGNNVPVANANPQGSNALTIPISTPFRLTGQGTDADGHQLSYSWEQHDLANSAPPSTDEFPRAGDPTAPLFRSYFPSSSPTRTFPNRASLLAKNYLTKDEALPTVGRNMEFRLTVRDNQLAGGGVDWSTLQLTVDGNSGPFEVTAPNGGETWSVGNTVTINWDVANTGGYCSNVNIRLSLDGGFTFPILLAGGTANDGTEEVTVPANVPNTLRARIEIACANDSPVVFFDISDGDFTINSSNCLADGGLICPADPMSLPLGAPQLDLTLDHFSGTPLSVLNIAVTSADPDTDNNVVSDGSGTGGCSIEGASEDYKDLFIRVDRNGDYGFNLGSLKYMTLFDNANYDEGDPCASFLGSTIGPGTEVNSTNDIIRATLEECKTYRLRIYGMGNYTLTAFGFSGGSLFLQDDPPPAGYSYTYVAVNNANQQLVSLDAGANFTGLAAGNYQVFGLSYANALDLNTLTGQTIDQVNAIQCASFSKNAKSLIVEGGDNCVLGSAGLANVQCNDNGTNDIPGDDYITFDLQPTGTNLGGGYNLSVSGGSVSKANGDPATNIPYGVSTAFRLQTGSAGAGNVTATVTDTGTGSCTVNALINDPGSCSAGGGCTLSSAGLTNVQCNDNGSNGNPGDDYITFDLQPTGTNLGGGYNLSVSGGTVSKANGDPATNIPYGVSTAFRLQAGSAGAGNVTATITDTGTGTCTLNALINDPGSCSNGSGNCTTSLFTSTDVNNKIITGGVVVTSEIVVSGNGTINDVNVLNLNGNHTWINDITVTLKSPAGTEVVLFGAICNDEDNFDLNLDDAAATGINICPPVGGGTFQPQGSLSDFNGENQAGTWVLTIQDEYVEDDGQLLGWQLEICAVTGGGIDCPQELPVNGTIAADTYQAKNITSTGTINSNVTVSFLAEQSIIMSNGFHAQPGSTFSAKIQPCPAPAVVADTPVEYELRELKNRPVPTTAAAGDIGLSVRPNPFNGRTYIEYELEMPGRISLEVFTLTGQRVRVLVPGTEQAAGIHQLVFEPSGLPAGMYLLVMQAGGKREIRKLSRL